MTRRQVEALKLVLILAKQRVSMMVEDEPAVTTESFLIVKDLLAVEVKRFYIKPKTKRPRRKASPRRRLLDLG